jgi:hypothetical protein
VEGEQSERFIVALRCGSDPGPRILVAHSREYLFIQHAGLIPGFLPEDPRAVESDEFRSG